MQYNDAKKKAYARIREILKTTEEIRISALQLDIMENFGMAEIVVSKYLKKLKDEGYIEIVDDVVISKKRDEKKEKDQELTKEEKMALGKA